MPFDDDDDGGVSKAQATALLADEDGPVAPSSSNPSAHNGDNSDDEDGDDVQADFLKFAASLPGGSGSKSSKKRPAAGKKTLRRGEKDFESHGTMKQANVLEDSRDAMRDVLGYTRTHKAPGHKDYLRGWYYPDWWADAKDETNRGDDGVDGGDSEDIQEGKTGARKEEKDVGMFPRDRVVVLESDGGSTLFKSTGRVFRGLGKDTPARSKMWLLPEEALYLIERGDLDLWWPYRSLAEMFPLEKDGKEQDILGQGTADYELGIPLSLQAAYSLFIGKDGERGKISLEKYQVYTNLRRTGYTVLRAVSIPLPPNPAATQHASIWQWLFTFVEAKPMTYHAANGPLVKPGLYRSYRAVFEQQAAIQRHVPTWQTDPSLQVQDPFQIHYHVWKTGGTFSKARPPPPNFRIAVVDTRTTSVPTLEELDALLQSTPWDPPPADKPSKNANGGFNVGQMYRKLKHGYRNVILAVVDRGLISYIRLTELAFGQELLYPGFDEHGKPGGTKGGRGGGGGRGGRSGRGGRGGKRGG